MKAQFLNFYSSQFSDGSSIWRRKSTGGQTTDCQFILLVRHIRIE